MSTDEQLSVMPEDASYRIESSDSGTLITLSAELQEFGWSDMERLGEELLARVKADSPNGMMVDLSAFSGLDSLSVAILVRLCKTVKERQGTMVVVSRNEVVDDVLHMAGLDKVLTVVSTRDEGLRTLKSAAWEKRSFPVLAGLGLVAVLAASAGISLFVAPGGLIVAEAALFSGLACAALGAVIGGMLAFGESGGHLTVGLVVVLCSLGLLGVGLFHSAEWFGLLLPPK